MIMYFLQTLKATSVILPVLVTAGSALAQSNYTSGGQSWHGTWSFQSSSQESIALSRSKLIEEMQSGGLGPNTSIVTYDNRSNYVELSGPNSGSIENTNRVGDDIGRNTNVVGSMNTGENRVEVNGSNNTLDVANSATSSGCLDGSINEAVSQNAPSGVSAIANVLRMADVPSNSAAYSYTRNSTAGGIQSDCLK